MARNAELPILSENLEQLKNTAQSMIDIKDVAYVEFLNKRMETLLQEGKLAQPKTPSALLDPSKRQFIEHRDIVEFIVPVVAVKAKNDLLLLEEPGTQAPTIKEHIGWVRFGLSKEFMISSERDFMFRCAVLAIIFTLIGIALVYVMILFAARPLSALISAVKDVRMGEHDAFRDSRGAAREHDGGEAV